jgi:putative hydrolase of the HAD superfamily
MNVSPSRPVVIFDLGGVIVCFDHLEICRRLAPLTPHHTPDQLYDLVLGTDLVADYDTGRISSKMLYQRVGEFLGISLAFDEFARIWSDIFSENPDVVSVIGQLKRAGHTLYLLSNTNALHFEHIQRRFEVIHAFDRCVLSYECGVTKPDRGIYRRALEESGRPAAEHIYIDDVPEYAEAARQLDMQAIVFSSAAQLVRELRALGVEISSYDDRSSQVKPANNLPRFDGVRPRR